MISYNTNITNNRYKNYICMDCSDCRTNVQKDRAFTSHI